MALPLLIAPACGQAATGDEGPAELVVGTMLSPPFVTRGEDGEWDGLSIDLMKLVAADLKAEVEFRDYDYDFDGLLLAVEQRKIDAAIGTIPLSQEGEARFDFSHPYFNSGLGIGY